MLLGKMCSQDFIFFLIRDVAVIGITSPPVPTSVPSLGHRFSADREVTST